MSPVVRIPFSMSLCVAVLLFIGPSFAQNTINVPGDQPTIQGAINAANNGDTVLVAPGTYYENINFKGKAITVTSSAGAAQTIIDGGGIAPVVTFDTNETSSSTLSGFTLQNGTSTFNSLYTGGGVFVYFTSPTIKSNIIQNNTSCGGAGIGVYYGSPVIQGNTIQNNSTAACSGGGGQGISVGGPSSAQIIGNIIRNNTISHGICGGISIGGESSPSLRNNTINGNVAGAIGDSGTVGGGLCILNLSLPTSLPGRAVIVQNLIYGNSIYGGPVRGGGGIYAFVAAGAQPTFVNNTIMGNSSASQGSAVYITGYDDQAQFFNNLLIGADGTNAVYCDGSYDQTPPSFTNNDGYSATGTGFQGTCLGEVGANANISADPLFMNRASGDFHLQITSPARDAGTNTAANLPQSDFAGNPRILDGNNDCISTVDMGVYELLPSANVSFSTNSLGFASQVPGTSSTPQSVTLRNTASTCFQFSSIGITGDFTQSNTCSSIGLRGGASCVFNVTFSPSAFGTRLGSLTVSGSDGITSTSPSVSLSGIGADFSVSASPSSAAVKHGQSVKFTITVSPLGGAFGSAVALSCSGLPASTSCSFSPSSVTPGDHAATSVMTISTVGKTPRGSYNVLVLGKSGTDVHSTTVLLSVN